MAKRLAALALAFLLLLFAGCAKREFSLHEGRYVQDETETDGAVVPYLLIWDGRMTVVQDIGISYEPSGELEIDGNLVVLETKYAGEDYRWTFELTGDDRLKFLPEDSSAPEGWEETMTFSLVEDE